MFVDWWYGIFLFNLVCYIILKILKYKHYVLSHSERYLQSNYRLHASFLPLWRVIFCFLFFPRNTPFNICLRWIPLFLRDLIFLIVRGTKALCFVIPISSIKHPASWSSVSQWIMVSLQAAENFISKILWVPISMQPNAQVYTIFWITNKKGKKISLSVPNKSKCVFNVLTCSKDNTTRS